MRESINWKELIMDPFEINKDFETVTASLAKNGEYQLVNKMIPVSYTHLRAHET